MTACKMLVYMYKRGALDRGSRCRDCMSKLRNSNVPCHLIDHMSHVAPKITSCRRVEFSGRGPQKNEQKPYKFDSATPSLLIYWLYSVYK